MDLLLLYFSIFTGLNRIGFIGFDGIIEGTKGLNLTYGTSLIGLGEICTIGIPYTISGVLGAFYSC